MGLVNPGGAIAPEYFPVNLLNGWTAYVGYRAPSLCRFGDLIVINMVITGGASGSVVFILPEALRPTNDVSFIINGNGLASSIEISEDGQLRAYNGPGANVNASATIFATYMLEPA